MTSYEYTQLQKDISERAGAKTTDTSLRAFYAHAARGYEIKLENMTLAEAAK